MKAPVEAPTAVEERSAEVLRRTRTPPPAPLQASPASNAALQRLVRDGPTINRNPALLAAGGSRALQRWSTVSAKWSVSAPTDPSEREADAMATRIVASPAPSLINRVSRATAPPAYVPRLPDAPAGDGSAPDTVPASLEGLLANPGSGAALPDDIRERIEGHLGVSLAGVQVHTDDAARNAAAQLGARAFTAGPHIFLGPGETADDLALMAHEATHVVQQQAVDLYKKDVARAVSDLLPDVVLNEIRSLAADVPGYTMLTVAVGYDPVAGHDVARTPENLVRGVLGIVPFGTAIADKLLELQIVQNAIALIDRGLAEHNLSLARLQHEIDQAWDDMSVTKGITGNVEVIEHHVGALYQDALGFVRSIVDAVIQMIRDAAVGLAETYLDDSPVWHLATKVLHRDPLRGTPVTATTVEIISDFLRLIGQEQRLQQMQERGTLQKTADWVDTQMGRFTSLLSDLGALFTAAWDAIAPQNLPNLVSNLQSLARSAISLVERVGAFATDLISQALVFVKDALLGWLSEYAHHTRGFRLLTVILGEDPFTGAAVARTAEALIGGFITLLPNGEQIFAQFSQTGVIAQAAGEIDAAMSRLGISLDMILNTFGGVWDSLSLDDLLSPLAAFERILERFGEPIGRIVEFVGEVIKVVVGLILRLMNFPSDMLASIIANAMSAIDDISRDPVGFFGHLLDALKAGLSGFFDHVLTYLLRGLGDWLLRGLGSLGIQVPADLSPQSVITLVLQVLGITAEMLWQQLGERLGPDVVARIRGAIDTLSGVWTFIKDVQERGIAAVWSFISDKLGALWDTIIGMARDWIMREVVEKVSEKLLSMLDPTGITAVVNSFVAFFHAVQSAINYLREILQIVNEYVTTFSAIAKGNTAVGSAKVEQGLAESVPVAIGFMMDQIGLGDAPESVVEIIRGLREMVMEAVRWLIDQAVNLGQATLAAVGLGGGQQANQRRGDQVEEDFELQGEQHRLFVDPAGSLLVASPTSTPVSTIDALRDLYADYQALPVDATKPQKDAILHRMIDLIKSNTGLIALLAGGGQHDPPNLGEVGPHGNQSARFRTQGATPAYAPYWELESEHVIPRQFLGTFFDSARDILSAAGIPGMSEIDDAEYEGLTTVLIYRAASARKTHAVEGDLAIIRRLGRRYGRFIRQMRANRRPGDPIAPGADDVGLFLHEMADLFHSVLPRTQAAVDWEWGANLSNRGWTPGDPAANAKLDEVKSRVQEAFDEQLPQMVGLLDERISDGSE